MRKECVVDCLHANLRLLLMILCLDFHARSYFFALKTPSVVHKPMLSTSSPSFLHPQCHLAVGHLEIHKAASKGYFRPVGDSKRKKEKSWKW